MARYSKKFIEARFAHWAEEAGLSTVCWKRIDGRNVAQIGSVYLDYNACYGGYCINQIKNEGGGCAYVTGFAVRRRASELIAFLDGSRWTIRHLSSK